MTNHAHAFAEKALALMSERGISPTPANYELFYAYASGETPAVTRILGDLIESRRDMPQSLLDDLRGRFFGATRMEKAIDRTGSELTHAINAITTRLETAGRDAEAYGRTLSEASDELGGGQSPDDLQKLVAGLVSATQAMEARTHELEADLKRSTQDVAELRAKLDDVRKESLTDPLTGIPNRKAFDQAIQSAMEQARDTQTSVCLFMCDIDHFKAFNDRFGHQTGDQVLRLVANCLSENVKGRDTAARYGGEEFAVILPQTNAADGVGLANQIRRHVESKKLVKKSTGDVLGTITISIGVAELRPGDDSVSFVQRADACLYAAKGAGRNCVIAETDDAAAKAVDAA